jgi:hypothetical protein
VRRVEEAAAGGNPVEGNPSAGNVAPQAQTQTAQNTTQGDAATPLETGVRQREAALAKLNKERRQKRLRDSQELNECLGSGMDLLRPEQVGQITEAAVAAGNEPMDALRSFGENPYASEGDLREAVKGAVQVMIARSREQQQRAGTQRVAAESETPREVLRLPEARRAACQDIPRSPSGRMLRGMESEVEQSTITSVASGSTCMRRSGTATRISSEATAEFCIRELHVHTRQPTERQTPGDRTPLRLTACCKRWRSPRPRCCQQLNRCC